MSDLHDLWDPGWTPTGSGADTHDDLDDLGWTPMRMHADDLWDPGWTPTGSG